MKSKNRIFIILLLFVALAWQGYSYAQKQQITKAKSVSKIASPGLHIQEVLSDRILLEWVAPPFSIHRDPELGAVVEIQMGDLAPTHEPGTVQLPRVTELFDALPGNASVSLIESEFETINVGACLPMPEDFIVDRRPSSSSRDTVWANLDEQLDLSMKDRRLQTPKNSQLWPTKAVDIIEAGVYRGHRLLAFHLNPVQLNTETGEGRVLKRARIQVVRPNSSNNEIRLPDRANETFALRNLLGKLAETALPSRSPEAREAREQATLDDDFPVFNSSSWRIYVREDGIVRLTGEYLRTVGVPIEQITPWDLHIRNKGREIPIVVDGQEDGQFNDFDRIDFFGEPNMRTYIDEVPSLYQDPFSAENCYQLFWGDGQPGLRMGEVSGAWHTTWNTEIERSVRVKLHFERDRYFDRLSSTATYFGTDLTRKGPLALVSDNWFWGERIDALTSRDFEAYLPFPNPNAPYSFEPVIVRACLTGFSSNPGYNHYVTVSLNGLTDEGLTVGRQNANDPAPVWGGQSPVIFETTVGDTLDVENILTDDLINGSNIITVSVPGNAISGNSDKVLANWFEIEYERDMRARNSEFRFDFNKPVGDTVGYDIRGFPSADVQVWKIGHSRLTNLETRRVTPADESASWAVRFPLISDGPSDVLVFGENFVFQPFRMVPDTIQVDLRNHPGAEYVLIAYDPFLADTSLRILDSLRRLSFNNSVLTIPVSEVYEQFSGGLQTPYAIHDFLKYAYDNWNVRPTHCCLVGDAVLEQRENEIPGNQIPSFSPPTLQFGAATADYLQGCVSGPAWDIIPDIAVGRISSRTPQELSTYVGKILLYETDPDYENIFQSNVLMIADYFDPGPPRFDFVATYSEPTIKAMADSTPINVTRVYLDSLPAGQGPIRLREALREGCVAANYNGHGGGGVWSGSSLIDVGGVRLLNNRESFPFITNFTCYVGAFDDRSQASVLGEAFLFSRNNNGNLVGAIGFYSSSGVGWAIAGQSMQRKIYDVMLRPPAVTIGEASLMNKARWWSSGNSPLGWTSNYSMMMMMNLLGDPGLTLKIPGERIEPTILGETNVIDPIDSTGNRDSIRVVMTLPWEQDATSNSAAFVLPYNGDIYQESSFGVPALRSSHTPAFDETRVSSQFYTTRICTTEAMVLQDFVTTRGEVVVYVTNPILRRSAIGRFTIYLADSLQSVQIQNIKVEPGPVAFENEPFRIRVNVLHEDGIERVRFRGVFTPAQGPVQLDTLTMVEPEPGEFLTLRELGPYHFEGGSYRMKFFVTPVGGEEFESEYYDLRIDQEPDFNLIFLLSASPAERGGWRPYYYQPLTVQRSATSAILDTVIMRLTATRDSTYLESGDSVTVTVDSFASEYAFTNLSEGEFEREAWIPTSFQPGRWNVTVQVDPDSEYAEISETNNTRSFVINMPTYYPAARNIGTFTERPFGIGPHKYWSTTKHDTLELRIIPGVLPRDSAAVGYAQPRVLTPADTTVLGGKGLRVPFSQGTHGVFSALFDDSLGTLGGDFRAIATLKLEGRDTLRSRVPFNDYALYVKDPQLEQWIRARNATVTRVATDTMRITPPPADPRLDTLVVWQLNVTGEINSLGELGVFRVTDTEGPEVEVSVGGLRYTQGAIVPANPEIFATIRDNAGVQRSDTSFRLVLDGDTVSPSLITWNDTTWTANSLTAMFEPDLEPGDHLLQVIGTDNHGNVSIYDATFEVRSEFGIEWAINYPNPFAKNTTIAYVLTGVTDQFTEIKIYTVSGRHIRTLKDSERTTANYRTLIWDGRDEDGEEVANGVYFARIVAQQGDSKIEETVKLAKVRK